jgi:hypothetical protein
MDVGREEAEHDDGHDECESPCSSPLLQENGFRKWQFRR